MNILVTGGAGFIGSNFILYWLKNHANDKIINVDSLTYAGNLENLISVEKLPNYKFFHIDILDYKKLDIIFNQIDTVVHFAAESHVDRSIKDPSAFTKTNINGTQTLLDLSLKYKINRFHHISTDEVFGELSLNSNKKFTENTNYDPRSPYSASKAASDHLVRAYYYTYKLPVTISNCSNNYGPYQFPEKLIPLAITNILEGKKIPIYGDGLYIRDWLYVEDHCRAIDMILKYGKIGETYCVGGMTNAVSNLDIIYKIIKYMGAQNSLIEHIKDRPGHDRKYAIDWTKIHKNLGWEPKHDFETYLYKTIDWYKQNFKWWQRVKSGEYRKYYLSQYGGDS